MAPGTASRLQEPAAAKERGYYLVCMPDSAGSTASHGSCTLLYITACSAHTELLASILRMLCSNISTMEWPSWCGAFCFTRKPPQSRRKCVQIQEDVAHVSRQGLKPAVPCNYQPISGCRRVHSHTALRCRTSALMVGLAEAPSTQTL
jgi:hypothetical protein